MTMSIRMFHVGDGDCLLLSAQDAGGVSRHILIDGGRSTAFKNHVAPALSTVVERDEGGSEPLIERLDLVVVSHIDNDHVSGILRLLKDLVVHKVWQHKKQLAQAAGTTFGSREPRRPPPIGELWHNSVRDQVELPDEVGQSLAIAASLVGGSVTAAANNSALGALAANLDNLATGHRSAIELEGRIRSDKLNISTNSELLLSDEAATSSIGPFTITVIGPSAKRVEDLRKDWKRWLEDNKQVQQELQRRIEADEEAMGESPPSPASPLSIILGASGQITVPNLASLMLLVDCAGTELLLTGDGSSEDIIEGLGLVDGQSRHVNLFKIPHHGAEANVTDALCRSVTADHYLFCGNGAHSNPELSVLQRIFTSRVNVDQSRRRDSAFKFWFSASPRTPGLSDSRRAHMNDVEQLMNSFAATEPRFSFDMLDAGDDDGDGVRGPMGGTHRLLDLSLPH